MIKPALTTTIRDLLGDLIVTIATLAIVGMLFTIGVGLLVVAARHFGGP